MEIQLVLGLSFTFLALLSFFLFLQIREKNLLKKDLLSVKEALQSSQSACVELEARLKEETGLLKKDLEQQAALFEKDKELYDQKLRFLDDAKQVLENQFKSLTHDILQKQQESFLLKATENFKNLKAHSLSEMEQKQKAVKDFFDAFQTSLKEVNVNLHSLEKSRVQAYSSLEEHLKHLGEAQKELRKETSHLSQALKVPAIQGKWGEVQLRRVVEMAGLQKFCDFYEQVHVEGDSGQILRPDIVVRLPNERTLVIDAKAPLQAYMEAMQATEEEKASESLSKFSKSIKQHLNTLSKKSYWKQFETSPEFVVMFLPGEVFYSAALLQDPTLIEFGIEKKVILATPTTLVALLRSVAYGWNQNQLTENARHIASLGKQLYDRLSTFQGHFDDIKKGIDRVVGAYNKSVASFETRLMPAARKLKETGLPEAQDLKSLELLEQQAVSNIPD